MSYYSSDEMKLLLEQYPQYKDKLYCRGFLISDECQKMGEYPFYNNWNVSTLTFSKEKTIYFYTHNLTNIFTLSRNDYSLFLIGHAYNPYTGDYKENKILEYLMSFLEKSDEAFWEHESELTGVFLVGFIKDNKLTFSTDCCGMQLAFYGNIQDRIYITSHSKLVADICELSQDSYITRLVKSKFYHYWGTFLPGDLSPYMELKRTQPNFAFSFNNNKKIGFYRYFPKHIIKDVSDEEYSDVLDNIITVLENTLLLISKKWPNNRAAISVTGGRDSTTTLASARKVYNELSYFSYISNEAERVDAEAAKKICSQLGLAHKIYSIPDESALYKDIDVIKKILECNAGCIGHNNLNDVKKRIYLDQIHDFDVEVKSWVDELSRCEGQNKYNMRSFPVKPTPGYLRCMWKVIVNPRLIMESNKVFENYIRKFYCDEVLSYMNWVDLYYWEFSWSSGEGNFLTSEHKYSDDITIPYNNRKLLNTMLTVPFDKRMNSSIQIDAIRRLDERIEKANAHVKDIAHTDMWSFIIRTYLKLFSVL